MILKIWTKGEPGKCSCFNMHFPCLYIQGLVLFSSGVETMKQRRAQFIRKIFKSLHNLILCFLSSLNSLNPSLTQTLCFNIINLFSCTHLSFLCLHGHSFNKYPLGFWYVQNVLWTSLDHSVHTFLIL